MAHEGLVFGYLAMATWGRRLPERLLTTKPSMGLPPLLKETYSVTSQDPYNGTHWHQNLACFQLSG